MKKYEFYMSTGNSSITAIIEDIKFFENGVLKATKVAKPVGYNKDGNLIYQRSEHKEFFAGGPFVLEEWTGELEPRPIEERREEAFEFEQFKSSRRRR